MRSVAPAVLTSSRQSASLKRASLKEHKVTVFGNYINGEFVDSKSGRTFQNINPANFDDVVGTFQSSNEADVEAACSAPVAARHEGPNPPATKRGEYLFKAAELLTEKLPQ